MPNDIETLIRRAAPPVTPRHRSLLAAVDVSEEAAAARHAGNRRRGRLGAGIGAAALLVVAGAGIATATTNGLWWTAPHEVVAEATPVDGAASPVTSVGFILDAEYAPGVDGGSREAQQAFQLAQRWLADRPIVVAVPADARTLTDDEENDAASRGVPARVALEQKAIKSVRDEIEAAVTLGYDDLVADLGAYLTDQGAEPSSIVITREAGVFEVVR